MLALTPPPFETINTSTGERVLPVRLCFSLLEQLPRRSHLLENAEGAKLDLKHLRQAGFTGYTLAYFADGRKSLLLHYMGKLVYAQHNNLEGHTALDQLMQDVPKASLSIYRVLPPVMILAMAPLLGRSRAIKPMANPLQSEHLLENLKAEGFSGAVVLQAEPSTAWYLREGRLFQSPTMPPHFPDGTLHLCEVAAEPAHDLLESADTSQKESVPAGPSTIWQTAEAVLGEYLGPSAPKALEKLRKEIHLEDPKQLGVVIKQRLEAVLGRTAAQRFAVLIKES